jgi:rhamnosyltransferase
VSAPEPKAKDVRVTVVIRTLNEARHIGACIDAILTQDEPCDVLVIDSGSTDGTVEEVRRRPAVRLHGIDRSAFTFGGACNLGAELCTTPFICYISGHALPAGPSWLGALLEPFADDRVAGVYGRQLPLPDQDPLRTIGQLRAFTESEETVKAHFSNANAAVRRSDWEAIRFDETLSGAEDYDWLKRQEAAGRVVRYAPRAEIYHSHHESLRQTYRRFFIEGAGLDRWQEPPPRLGRLVREWRTISRNEAANLYRRGHRRWALWAPLYFAARYAGDYRGRRSAMRSPSAPR